MQSTDAVAYVFRSLGNRWVRVETCDERRGFAVFLRKNQAIGGSRGQFIGRKTRNRDVCVWHPGDVLLLQ